MAVSVGILEAVLRLKNQLSGELDRVGKDMEVFGQKLAKTGAGLSANITLPIAAIGVQAIKMAMDAEESENLFAVSFGSMADSARSWSETTSKALGLNEFELRKQSATMFTMIENMGLGRDEAFEMATGITKLSIDMASFRNLRPEDSFAKLQAAITGEAEGLKRLGILIDGQTVKTEAYTTGIAEMDSTLTNTQKVQARWSAILRQTTQDQGDAAATMGSATNVLRSMKSTMEQLGIELGIALLPTFQSLLSMINEHVVPALQSAMEWFQGLSPSMQKVGIAAVAVVAAIGPLLIVVGTLAAAFGAALPVIGALLGPFAIGGLIVALGVVAAKFEPLRVFLIESVGLYIDLGKRGIGFVVEKFKELTEWMSPVLDKLAALAGWVKGAVASGFNAAASKIAKFRDELKFGDEETAALNKTLDELGTDVLPTVTEAVEKLAETMGGGGGSALDAALKKMSAGTKEVQPVVAEMATHVSKWDSENKTLFKGIKEADEWIFDHSEVVGGLTVAFDDLGAVIKDASGEIVSAGAVIGAATDDAITETSGLFGKLKEGWADVKSNIMASAADMLVAVVSGTMELDEAIQATFRDIGSQIGAAFGPLGAMAGAMIGDIVGEAIGGLFSKDVMTNAERIFQDAGIELGEELADAIMKTANDILGGDQAAAIKIHLADIIEEEAIKSVDKLQWFANEFKFIIYDFNRGALSAGQAVKAVADAFDPLLDAALQFNDLNTFEQLTKTVGRFMRELAAGTISAAQANELLESTFPRLVEAAREFGAEGLRAIRNLIHATRRAGQEFEEIRRFISDGVELMLEAAQKVVDSGVASAANLHQAGLGVARAFNEAVAAGLDLIELQERFAPVVKDLIRHYRDMGMKVPQHLKELRGFLRKLGDEDVQSLLFNLQGVGAIIEASIALAIPPTQKAFERFSETINSTYEALRKQGLTGKQAVRAILPQLLDAAALARDFGFELDENTKRLLTQAGIDISLMPPSEVDVMIQGFDRMTMGINRLIETMGGVPVMFEEWGTAAQRAERDLAPLSDFAAGAERAAERRRRRAAGGLAGGSPGTAFEDFGGGTNMVLHGREAVVTPSQATSVGGVVAGMVSRAISGAGSGNATTHKLLREHNDRLDALSETLRRQQSEIATGIRDANLTNI